MIGKGRGVVQPQAYSIIIDRTNKRLNLCNAFARYKKYRLKRESFLGEEMSQSAVKSIAVTIFSRSQ
jgi:hypothetical protein